MFGAICLSNSSHFAPMLDSNSINPVMLPPGCFILATSLRLTGSLVPMNTIGIVRVTSCNAVALDPLTARTTSGASAINSCANLL